MLLDIGGDAFQLARQRFVGFGDPLHQFIDVLHVGAGFFLHGSLFFARFDGDDYRDRIYKMECIFHLIVG
jgi:hypothetical protein